MLRPLGSGRRRSLARGARWLLGRGTRSDGDSATAIPHDSSAPGVWDANPRVHTEGTRLLLEASLSAGFGTYLQQSITLAYPDRGDQWLDEDTPLDDSPERAEVVIPVRFMSAQVRSVDLARLRWCVLRGGMLVGPGTAQEATVAQLQAGEGRVTMEVASSL